VAALAACTSAPQGPQPELDRPARQVSAEGLESCKAGHLADAIGKTLVESGAGPNEVNLADLPETRRIVFPGQPVTMDFRPDRLTMTTTRAGVITQLTCG
jgi:hypothetical protein